MFDDQQGMAHVVSVVLNLQAAIALHDKYYTDNTRSVGVLMSACKVLLLNQMGIKLLLKLSLKLLSSKFLCLLTIFSWTL